MPIPDGTLERSFTKQTLSASVKATQTLGKHQLQMGTSVEYQHNRRGGWGFILPDFEQLLFGAFAIEKWQLNDNLSLTAGARYDHGRVSIHSYHDWYKTPVATGDSVYTERSASMKRSFNSFTWSVGMNQIIGNWVFKFNVGKSFRMPIAKELGMDGVNYNIFRYEKGNTSLKPEESYQADAGIVYEHNAVSVQFTPYLNYFPNYIYLNPTSGYREGLQLYYYTLTEVMRWGFEATTSWKPLNCLKLTAEGEYLYARQLSGEKKGYGLPFSTPWSARAEVRYLLPVKDPANSGFVAVEWQVVGTQDRIVPPEKETKGHQLLNASVGKKFQLGANRLELILHADNLLDKRIRRFLPTHRRANTTSTLPLLMPTAILLRKRLREYKLQKNNQG